MTYSDWRIYSGEDDLFYLCKYVDNHIDWNSMYGPFEDINEAEEELHEFIGTTHGPGQDTTT